MQQFAEWLSRTSPSVFIQNHNNWVIPTIQSIHIVGIGVVMGSVFLIYLRILGWAGTDQTLRQIVNRFGPWLTGALYLMLVTGILMIVGEPVRELITFSFWAKMVLVAASVCLVIGFRRSVRKREEEWEKILMHRRSIRIFTLLSFLIWTCIIILGRLIAYDHVWGSWSPAAKA